MIMEGGGGKITFALTQAGNYDDYTMKKKQPSQTSVVTQIYVGLLLCYQNIRMLCMRISYKKSDTL